MTRRSSRPYRPRKSDFARWLVAETPPGRPILAPALTILNGLKAKGLVVDYAIGGGMGAMRYTEPFTTMDLDVFFIPAKQGISAGLPGIYGELKRLGYDSAGESVMIEGVPVQFLATDALTEEAVRKAPTVTYSGIKTKVMSAEHLIAIAARAGRKKDMVRVEMMFNQAGIDRRKLRDILSRHGLAASFKKTFGKYS